MAEHPTPTRPFAHAGLAMLVAKRYWIEGLDLDDLYQICCEAIWRAEPRYDGSKGSRSTFLYRVAANELTKTQKALKVQKRTAPGGLASMQIVVDEHGTELGDLLVAPNADPALIVEQRDAIRRALEEATLTKGERACLVASAVGAEPFEVGYSHQLGVNARRKLRAAA